MTATDNLLKKVVLIVEDDKTINQLLDFVLIAEGVSTRQAYSARQALNIVNDTSCDLITLDLGLPDMDGNAFLAALPAETRHIPVVVITANPQLLKPHNQVCAVINKPFDIMFVAKQVKTFLNVTRQGQVI